MTTALVAGWVGSTNLGDELVLSALVTKLRHHGDVLLRAVADRLQLAIGEPEMQMMLSRVRHAGTVFLGETSSVAYGATTSSLLNPRLSARSGTPKPRYW